MAKKKRKYNPNLIRSRRSYTFVEVAEIYQLHFRTVQLWHQRGLKVIDENCKPLLVLGQDVRDFIKRNTTKLKCKLKDDEFYCTKCRCARKSCPYTLSFNHTDIPLGKNSVQVIITGKCEVCNSPLNRFCSDQKFKEMRIAKDQHLNGKQISDSDTPLASNIVHIIESDKTEQLELWK